MRAGTPDLSGSSTHPGLAAVLVLLVAIGVSAAETLNGAVADPQQRWVAGANITLRCREVSEVHRTDSQGRFVFERPTFPANCSITVESSGFASLERVVGADRVLLLQLQVAQIKQTLSVTEAGELTPPVVSVSLNARELREIPGDTRDWLTYAEHVAGVQPGSDHIYVDGLPADTLPPSSSVERIIVNADPFSAEYSDGSSTHVDVITRNAERKIDFQAGNVSFGPAARNPLNPHLASNVKSGQAMLTGPIPSLPLVFTVAVDFYGQKAEQSIQAVVPVTAAFSIASVAAAPTSTVNRSSTLTAYYSGNETLRANVSFHVLGTKSSNMNVSGLTLPDAGMSKGITSRELRTTVTKLAGNYMYRGGAVGNWSNSRLDANSNSLGVSVPGAFVAGGAEIDQQTDSTTKWTLKNVLELNPGGHLVSIGATVTRAGESQLLIPNSFGRIQFDNMADYVASATTGAPTGIWFVQRGTGYAHYRAYTAAPFVEGEVLRHSSFSLRAGLRADYQTRGGTLYSPRLSAATLMHGFVIRTGTGMFTQNWPTYVFVREMASDGRHLQEFLATNASLSYAQADSPILPYPIISSTSRNLTPAREWISKVSIDRRFAYITPGVEYTWTVSTHLLGSQRQSAPVGWTDILESNRASRKQQIHLRTGFAVKGQTFTGHYEWIRARDNTDGPFSYPGRQNDLSGEWAPASNVAPHNVTLVAHFKIKSISLTLLEAAHTAVPLNVTSGLDPERNGLYTDRAGRLRNSGTGPAYSALSVYVHRRFALPSLSSRSNRKLYLDAGLQGENVLDHKNYVTLNGITSSPLFGQPLAALAGRSLRISVGIVPH